MELTGIDVAKVVAAAFLVGFSKTGVVGMGVLIIPLMATVFPGKASIGVLLPMLIFADVFAVVRYRRHADWKVLGVLLLWVIPGMGLGFVALRTLPDASVTPVLGGLVLVLIVLKGVMSYRGKWLEEHLPRQWWFSAVAGILAGFTTTLGNAAGSIMSIYLISMGLKKKGFMGTGAYYYMIVNWLKVPLQLMVRLEDGQRMINAESLRVDLQMAPVIAVGAVVGILVFRVIPQKWFNRVILALAAAAALKLLFG